MLPVSPFFSDVFLKGKKINNENNIPKLLKKTKEVDFPSRSANLNLKIVSSMFNIKYTMCCRTSYVWFEVACRELFPVALIHVGRSPPLENLLYNVKQKPYAFLCPLLKVENHDSVPLLIYQCPITYCPHT